MKTSALSVLLFLSFPASAQLFLDNRQLLAFPGTYGDDISLPADAELRIYGTGDYVLSGVLHDERWRASRLTVAAGNGRLLLTGLNAYTGVTEVVSGELSVRGSLVSPVTVRRGAVLSSGGRGRIKNTVDVESGGTIQGGREAGTLTVGELVLRDGAALDVYASGASVSKIVSSRAPSLGALTVRLKNAMSVGTYALIEAPGTATPSAVTGENYSGLFCTSFAWRQGRGLLLSANGDFREETLSGGGTLADGASSGLSATLSASEVGVDYLLFRTLNNVVSQAAALPGTGRPLVFENLGEGDYVAKGRKDGCERLMRGSAAVSINPSAIKKGLFSHRRIPEAVKRVLDREAPKSKSTSYFLSELYPGFKAKAMGNCREAGYFYAGFRLSYDGGDKHTAADWAAQLGISLRKGNEVFKLTDSLKADLGLQTFETTVFFKDTIRCSEGYDFEIDSKAVKGVVPAGNLRLHVLLFETPGSRPELRPGASVASFACRKESEHEVKLSWMSAVAGAEEYDLEWVFIDEKDGFRGSREAAFSFLEPIRITTKDMEYAHPIYYPKGGVYYRVRPVGRQKRNPAQRIAGAWSYADSVGVSNHSRDKTWQRRTVFSEEGKHKTVMSYYDATGRLRQQSTNLGSEGVTLTAETMYDFEGRKSVEVMPVPALGNSLLYKSNLNPFLRGGDAQSRALSAVNKYHYDNGRRANSLLDTAASSGAGRYYSSGNDIANPYKDAVPKAEGYAYSQTEYTRDGTGRVSRQGGVGKELRIDGSRAVRHYYGSAAQEELRRLFGDKIGKASHYKKDVSVDANGQASVSYKDQEGRIAATALAGGAPADTGALASCAAQTGTPVRLRLDDKNSKRAGASETVHTFINVAPNSEMSIDYGWTSRGKELPSGCAACGYKLTVSLTAPSGDKADLGTVPGDEDTGPSYARTLAAASCAENAEHVIRFTGVRLSEVGDYTIRKVLVPTVLSYEQIRESVRRLPATAAYRETIKAVNLPDFDACEGCRGCNKEALINASLREIAEKGCEKILDSIKSRYGKNNSGAEMPASHLANPSNDPLICKYNYCVSTLESTIFDSKLAMIQNRSEAVRKSYGTVASVIAADPFFDDGGTPHSHGWERKNDMVARMGQILVPDLDIGKSQSARQDMSGPIDDVTDPDASRYFIDRYGRPNASGRHFLYYELKTRLAQDSITRAEYEKQLGEQRWAMFRHYYQEGKRQIKIEENAGCASMLSELQAQDALPDTKDKMINKARGQHDAYRRIQAKMTVLAIKRSCAPGLTRADSTALGNSLFEYFKSTPYNYMCVIDSADLASDAAGRVRNRHLEQFRVLLETNYAGCRLGVFAARNPFKCLRDTTVYMDVPPPEPLRANSAPARGMSEEEKRREEEMERELEKEEERRGALSERAEVGRQSEGTPGTAMPSPAAEVNALIDFYNATGGESGWTRHANWQTDRIGAGMSLYIGNWYGVSINGAGNVIALELSDNNLPGRLTDTLAACPRLARLVLFNNKLSGNPPALGRMPRLSELDLGNNLLSGSLAGRSADRSAGFLSAFFPNLRYLTLSNNQLTGRLEELGQMPHLIRLNLGSNKLTGILTELRRMPGLAEL